MVVFSPIAKKVVLDFGTARGILGLKAALLAKGEWHGAGSNNGSSSSGSGRSTGIIIKLEGDNILIVCQ
jgi:hypothetical protein